MFDALTGLLSTGKTEPTPDDEQTPAGGNTSERSATTAGAGDELDTAGDGSDIAGDDTKTTDQETGHTAARNAVTGETTPADTATDDGAVADTTTPPAEATTADRIAADGGLQAQPATRQARGESAVSEQQAGGAVTEPGDDTVVVERDRLEAMQTSMRELAAAATQIAESTEEVNGIADEQAETMAQVSAEASDLSATIEEIASSADQVRADKRQRPRVGRTEPDGRRRGHRRDGYGRYGGRRRGRRYHRSP